MSADSARPALDSLIAEMAALTPAQQAQVRAYVELVRSEAEQGTRGASDDVRCLVHGDAVNRSHDRRR